ncbi:MAG: hypothetical protein HWE30_19155 [Methylocystaceae bacterium]|nr:hypothetical protein [Methylocystaceae bacterium]
MAGVKQHGHRESVDTTLLILAFILGIGSAVILKYLGFPPWVPAVVTGSVIIGYALLTYIPDSARLEPEQIGDNCYYLGFCITLASLAYTLYGLSSAGNDSEMLSDVISGFGVALSSTVVGVMTRVVLLQYRVDLAARDKQARMEINKAMLDFKGVMSTSVTNTRETITAIRQSLDEHTAETIKQNERMQKAFDERLEALVANVGTSMQDVMNEVLESGKDMNRRIAASSRTNTGSIENALKQSMEQVVADLKRASEKLERDMELANTTSIKTLERVIGEVSAAMKLLGDEAAKSINASRAVQDEQISHAIKAVATNVFEVAGQIDTQKDKLREAIDEYTKQTNQARGDVAALVKDSNAAQQEVVRAVQTVTAAAAKAAGAADQMDKAVNRAFPQISQAEPRTTATNTTSPSADQAPTSSQSAIPDVAPLEKTPAIPTPNLQTTGAQTPSQTAPDQSVQAIASGPWGTTSGDAPASGTAPKQRSGILSFGRGRSK